MATDKAPEAPEAPVEAPVEATPDDEVKDDDPPYFHDPADYPMPTGPDAHHDNPSQQREGERLVDNAEED